MDNETIIFILGLVITVVTAIIQYLGKREAQQQLALRNEQYAALRSDYNDMAEQRDAFANRLNTTTAPAATIYDQNGQIVFEAGQTEAIVGDCLPYMSDETEVASVGAPHFGHNGEEPSPAAP